MKAVGGGGALVLAGSRQRWTQVAAGFKNANPSQTRLSAIQTDAHVPSHAPHPLLTAHDAPPSHTPGTAMAAATTTAASGDLDGEAARR